MTTKKVIIREKPADGPEKLSGQMPLHQYQKAPINRPKARQLGKNQTTPPQGGDKQGLQRRR